MARTQIRMMKEIMELEFVCLDLRLFVATHPEETKAIADLKKMSEGLASAKEAYERAQGLNAEAPWPWEIDWKRSE